MTTPDELAEHASDYKDGAWREYTVEELAFEELAWWVHLLVKRSSHRGVKAKRDKDLHDAANYARMLAAKIDEMM